METLTMDEARQLVDSLDQRRLESFGRVCDMQTRRIELTKLIDAEQERHSNLAAAVDGLTYLIEHGTAAAPDDGPDVTAVSNRFGSAWRLYTMDELAEGDLIRMDNDLDPQRIVRVRKNEMDPSKRTVVTDAGVYVRPSGDPVLVKR